MSDQPQITINPNKSSELEFDVLIQGIDEANIPTVRFVISSIIDECDYSFKCSKISGEKSKWLAKMPAMPQLKINTAPFRVEVIIEEYFFTPAEGEIMFVTTPTVQFKDKKTPKPTVSTSFVVKQAEDEEDKKPKKETKKPLKETPQGGGGGEITGRYAPTNALLKPEEDPTENGRMRVDTSVNDEFTDKDRLSLDTAEELSSSITPGEGRAYQQEDGKNEEDTSTEEEEFDPKKVADSIMKATVGKAPKTITKGTLFNRDSAGKTVIKGLERAETVQTRKENAKKVKDILGTK